MSNLVFSADELSKVRSDFPILGRKVHGRPLVYLDNAATSQKPEKVIRALSYYYSSVNANVHRGVHLLSQEATELYEGVRPRMANFLGVEDEAEVIFTKGTTDSINMIAQSWGDANVGPDDDVIVTRMEHHSNFVPWQALAKRRGANFKIVELDSDLRIDFASLEKALSGRPKVLAITHMSNVTGVVNPVKEIAEMAKAKGATVVLDSAQGVPHMPVSVKDLGSIDFLALSSHKMCGPTGIGILWGRRSILEAMPPCQYGGDMIRRVQDEETSWNELPWKFEAGTPNIADVIGFGAAIDYLSELGMDRVAAWEAALTERALAALTAIEGVRIIGPAQSTGRGAVFSFLVDRVHAHDLSQYLDHQGVAIRAGHHCAQPLLQNVGVAATGRASFSFYNQESDIDALADGIRAAQKYFG